MAYKTVSDVFVGVGISHDSLHKHIQPTTTSLWTGLEDLLVTPARLARPP